MASVWPLTPRMFKSCRMSSPSLSWASVPLYRCSIPLTPVTLCLQRHFCLCSLVSSPPSSFFTPLHLCRVYRSVSVSIFCVCPTLSISRGSDARPLFAPHACPLSSLFFFLPHLILTDRCTSQQRFSPLLTTFCPFLTIKHTPPFDMQRRAADIPPQRARGDVSGEHSSTPLILKW